MKAKNNFINACYVIWGNRANGNAVNISDIIKKFKIGSNAYQSLNSIKGLTEECTGKYFEELYSRYSSVNKKSKKNEFNYAEQLSDKTNSCSLDCSVTSTRQGCYDKHCITKISIVAMDFFPDVKVNFNNPISTYALDFIVKGACEHDLMRKVFRKIADAMDNQFEQIKDRHE